MSLSKEEFLQIESNESSAGYLIEELDNVRKFKEGDYLIAHYKLDAGFSGQKTFLTNSYGAIRKFKVVAVDKHGIPYIKELDRKGRHMSNLISMFEAHNTADIEYNPSYELDPDYADSIILDDHSNYDPAVTLREKSKEFKEIAEYNKKIKVNTSDEAALVTFVRQLQVHSTFWRSNKTSLFVLEIAQIPFTTSNKIAYHKPVMKVQDNKNNIKWLTLDDIWGRAVYPVQPKTYKGLKDPK